MREVIDQHLLVVERAREDDCPCRVEGSRAGDPRRHRRFAGPPSMGLPTPNVFAGEQNFHSRLEWVSVQDMEKAVDVIVSLARLWEEKT